MNPAVEKEFPGCPNWIENDVPTQFLEIFVLVDQDPLKPFLIQMSNTLRDLTPNLLVASGRARRAPHPLGVNRDAGSGSAIPG